MLKWTSLQGNARLQLRDASRSILHWVSEFWNGYASCVPCLCWTFAVVTIKCCWHEWQNQVFVTFSSKSVCLFTVQCPNKVTLPGDWWSVCSAVWTQVWCWIWSMLVLYIHYIVWEESRLPWVNSECIYLLENVWLQKYLLLLNYSQYSPLDTRVLYHIYYSPVVTAPLGCIKVTLHDTVWRVTCHELRRYHLFLLHRNGT